jgi:hypothetical protein
LVIDTRKSAGMSAAAPAAAAVTLSGEDLTKRPAAFCTDPNGMLV